MKTVIVNRDSGDYNQTNGVCYIKAEDGTNIFKSESIERGWRDNESNVSCIPAGQYDLALEWSERFGQVLWEVYGVPGRSECKFHAANYARQLNGCIALGKDRMDIDGDGNCDVTSSRDTMALFHETMGSEEKQAILIVNDI